jgi:hypothetical protein
MEMGRQEGIMRVEPKYLMAISIIRDQRVIGLVHTFMVRVQNIVVCVT